MQEAGAALVPGAFLPTVFASAVLTEAGLTGKLLAALATGSKAGVVSLGAALDAVVLLTCALTIGGGTTGIQLNIIAERMLGLPRDPDPPVQHAAPVGSAPVRAGAHGRSS